ncbi:MAG: methylated-DNA--[protein]-cysteine S-methyltransferase [Planctomycetota bacterium]|jgi:O-6-methylguanine DNA methyltransferase
METVHITTFDTAMGKVTLASTDKGVVANSLPGCAGGEVSKTVKRLIPDAEIVKTGAQNARAVSAVKAYLSGRRKDLDLPLDLRGTPFQKKVWTTLRRVPYGRTISYAELAKRAGHPRAARACGTANGANPVPLFVPCHRTLATGGGLGGFGGGLPLKKKLLDFEATVAART